MERPREDASQKGPGDDARAQVDQVDGEGLLVVARHELVGPGTAEGAGPRQGGGGDGVAPVGEEQEEELRAQALDEAGVQGGDAPLGSEGGGHRGGEELDEEGGAGLADDEAAQGPAQHPDAGGQAAEAGGQVPEELVPGATDLVPHQEDEAARDGEYGGGDEIDDPPSQFRGGGGAWFGHAQVSPLVKHSGHEGRSLPTPVWSGSGSTVGVHPLLSSS